MRFYTGSRFPAEYRNNTSSPSTDVEPIRKIGYASRAWSWKAGAS